MCCLILGFTEYREKDWAKAGSSRGNGVRPWSQFLTLCSSPRAWATEGSWLSLTGSASFAVRLVFYTQAGGSPLLPQCSLGGGMKRSMPGVCEGALFPVCCGAVPLVLGENCGSFRSKHIAASTPNKWYRLKFHSEGMVVIEAIHGTTNALPPSKLNI